MVKLIIIFVLVILITFSGYMEGKETRGSYINLPGCWGILCAGLVLSTIIVLIVFGILHITG